MSLYILFSLINGITAIAFGLFIFLKNWKNTTNVTFFLMSASVAMWSFSYCKWLSVSTAPVALFWSRMLNLGATFIPIFYLHWILSILNITKEKKKVLIFGYTSTFLFSFFSFSPLYISSVAPIFSFPYWPQAGIFYVFFLIFGYFGLTTYGLSQLIKARKNADKEKEHQINYVLVGSIFGFGGGATNFPLMFGLAIFPPIGQSLVVVYIIIFTLATLRYHLFDIKVILTELLIVLIALILLFQAITAPTLILNIFGFGVLALFGVIGIYLIKSILKEITLKDELEIAYQDLQKLDKAKSEFVSIASHQLRTPLTAIKGYVSLLLEGSYGKLTKRNRPPIENVYQSSERLIRLINELLNISRIETGRLEMNFEETPIEEVINLAMEETKIQAEKKKLYLKLEKPEASLPKVSLDKDKIKQAIMNVVDNAIKYTTQGGVVIKAKSHDSKVMIEVSDTGDGMEKEEMSKLFKSFSRGSAGNKLSTEGAGLGLHIAKSFVEFHGGRIWAESPGKGKGSTVY
ncbi:MAG: sensor histidine kinase, partial [Parcubacteria group bacterium]